MSCVLGVDGGNTKTAALVAGLDGTVRGFALGGCGDIYGAPSAGVAMDTVESTAATALERAGARPRDLAVGAFSMAGADWPEDFSFIRTRARNRGLGRRIVVVNDAVGALRAGSPDGTGVAVVCGTHVAVAARAPDGRTWHHSWWQQPGGARELGTKALRAVYRAELGIDPPTRLKDEILAFFGQRSVEAVLHSLTARERSLPADVGGLARVLLDAAEAGDALAHRIVEEHAVMLGDYALAAARRVGIEDRPFILTLMGGVFKHPGLLHREILTSRVHRSSPDTRVAESRFEPVAGAVLLALDTAGVEAQGLMARLAGSMPSPSAFSTWSVSKNRRNCDLR